MNIYENGSPFKETEHSEDFESIQSSPYSPMNRLSPSNAITDAFKFGNFEQSKTFMIDQNKTQTQNVFMGQIAHR